MSRQIGHATVFGRRLGAVVALTLPLLATPGWAICPGDLNDDGFVMVDEVLTLVDKALNGCPARPSICPGDADGDGIVSVADILAAAYALLSGCPGEPTSSPTPHPSTSTPLQTQTGTTSATITPSVTATPSQTPAPPSCPFTFDDDTLSLNILCDYIGAFSFDPDCPGDLQALFTSYGGSTVGVAIGTADSVVMFVGTKVSSTQADLIGYTVGDQTELTPSTGTIELQQGGRVLVIAPDSSPFELSLDQQVCSFDHYDGSFVGVMGGGLSPAPNGATAARLVAWVADAPLAH